MHMNYKANIITVILSSALMTSVAFSQDEEATKSKKEAPVVGEFSTVMRNLMNRAKANGKDSPDKAPQKKFDVKVDEIQTILNKSDRQVAEAAKINKKASISKSADLEDSEVAVLKAEIEEDKVKHVIELQKTKSKIADIEKTIKDEKKKLALRRANKAVEKALKLLEKEKKD